MSRASESLERQGLAFHYYLSVPTEILMNFTAARSSVVDMLLIASEPTINDTKKVLFGKKDVILALDPTFLLELHYLEEQAEGAVVELVHKQIFDALPTKTRRTTLKQAVLGDP